MLGKSVRGRQITAWHLDNRPIGKRRGPTVVLIATMHGNEGAPRRILRTLRGARAIHGVDLWLVPVYNPDGLAANHRRNAHGVDLNRNYPYHWADLDGNYESGPHPGSEPETKAMMRFLREVSPDYVLSFHQPLHGVDTDNKRPGFSRHVARTLAPAGHHPRLRRCLPRHHDRLVQPQLRGLRAHRRVRRAPAAPADADRAPRQVLKIFDAFGSFGGR